ncbi:MAG: class I SAM-dependent methyltransferase [Phycisphaerales bacterium]|nr:class I SAM-dependent methyltransferase [Phycisphaerales bacterium]MCB9863911.1 class I SAM-dependent methyltransferase [Phycisphaerales bacterium]
MTPTNRQICPLCRGPLDRVHRHAGRSLHHCNDCDLICVPPTEHLDRQAEKSRYLFHENSIENAAYVATFDGPLAMLAAHAPTARRVLDYGSGPTPVLVELLRRRGHDAVGFDPYFASDTDIAGPFDAVISVETFEHFRDPRAELERLRTRLAPGAPLIVKTLFHPGPDALEDWYYLRDKTHVAFYSPATFEWIAEAFDLRLIHHDGHSLACLIAPEIA